MEFDLLPPCPSCKAPATRGVTTDGQALHFIECSRRIDCPEWPSTDCFASPDAAETAWHEIILASGL